MRRKRMATFVKLIEPLPEPIKVLDVGGTAGFWLANAPSIPKQLELTLLNLEACDTQGLENARSVAGDARRMPEFETKSFDVCFSNSVIEHVGNYADQRAMAGEVRRVAQAYYIQTPYRYFPIEPHFLFPCWQFLPTNLRAALHRRFKLGWMPAEPDPVRAREDVEQIRLLNQREYRELFPDAELVPETLAGLTKSLVAIRRKG